MTILMRALFTLAGAFAIAALVVCVLWVWTGDLRYGGLALIAAVAAAGAVFSGAGVASSLEARGKR